MKSHFTIASLVAAAALACAVGCSKQEPTASGTETPSAPSADTQVKKATDAVASQAGAVQATADKAAADAQAQAGAAETAVKQAAADAQTQTQAAASSISSKAQTSLDQVQKLLADNKPADALKMIGDLAGMKLTPEQQSLLEKLKQQAQQLLQKAAASSATDKAADAVGGLLKK